MPGQAHLPGHWDTSRVPHYVSPVSLTTVGDGAFHPVTVTTGGIALAPGQNYVAFLSCSDLPDYAATTGTGNWAMNFFTHQANGGGGGFVFSNNGSDFAALTNTDWNFISSDFGDATWQATFTVPESNTLALLLAALPLLSVMAIRVRKK